MDITHTNEISDVSQLPSVIEWKKWQEEFLLGIEKKIMKNPNLLDSEMRSYISKARFQVYDIFPSPPIACIMSEYVGYAIRFFADLEQSIFKRRVDLKDYYHSMSELIAMYCDLRVNALLLNKDRLDEIRNQFLYMLRQFLANNCDYITNTLLRIQRLRVSRLLFENMFKLVEQNANFERTQTNCVSYCRYILFYRQWKKMYSDKMILREISGRAVEHLKPPPNFRKHKLFEILCPKNSRIPPNLTLFLLTAQIITKVAVDKFFSIDKYEPETSGPDDLYEVVDLTDEVQSPKREDESLEDEQPSVNLTTNNRCIEDTYNLPLSFNNMITIDKNTSTQKMNIQSIASQSTSLSLNFHRNDQQSSWSPITRNIIANTNKEHQESIDTGIFSDRSSGNSPAYEMEVKDVHMITSPPSLSVTDKVITRVISSSCDKCGHKSSSSIVDVLPSTSSSQQIQTTKPSLSSSPNTKSSVIIILDDEEDVEQKSQRNFDQVTRLTNLVVEESKQSCSQNEALVPGDIEDDIIIVNNECSNNEESIIIEEVTPPLSKQIDKSNTSIQVESTKTSSVCNNKDLLTPTIASELTLKVNIDNVVNNSDLTQDSDNRTFGNKKANLKDVGVSTQDILDDVQEGVKTILNNNSDHLIKRDNVNKVRVMSIVDVTPNTSVGSDLITNLTQSSSSSTNQISNDTFTIEKLSDGTVIDNDLNQNEDVQNETAMNVDKDDEDMDTQQFVDQMFCSKPIEPLNNNKNNKLKSDANKDISDNDTDIDNDKSHCELTPYLTSPPQNDTYFYGFSSNSSGGDLLKSLSSNNNNNKLSSSLFSKKNNNNSNNMNNNDHSQCSIHLQNATRLTEEFVSTTRTRDQQQLHRQNKNTIINNKNSTTIVNNKSTTINVNIKNTKSILKTSKKSHSSNHENNNRKKSVVLSKDSYTRYIREDENRGYNNREQQNGTSSSLLRRYGPNKKHGGSIIIAENHYDKPEEYTRRNARYQDIYKYQHNSPHLHEHTEERRVLRQRSESRDRDPFAKYQPYTDFHQPKDLENGRYVPRRRCRSNSESQSSTTKRARFDINESNARVTRSRSSDRNRSFEDNTSFQNILRQTNARNRVKTEKENQISYEKLRRKYDILKEVQIILNETNNLSLKLYQKKLAEEKTKNPRKTENQRRYKRRESINYIQDGGSSTDNISLRHSEELDNESSNDHRKSRLSKRRYSNISDSSSAPRRGRSRVRIKYDATLKNVDCSENLDCNDRLTPTYFETINTNTTTTTSTESMYPSTSYFSTPVRIPEFVECLQASTTISDFNTPKNDEIRVPSIQSSIERLQNSLASPISLLATENTTETTFNDTNLNNKKFNSIKSGNLTKSNVTKKKLFNDNNDQVQEIEDNHQVNQNLDVLSSSEVSSNDNELPQLRTKGARKLLKDEMNRPIRQCRRNSSTSNRIFSTDTSSTRRLRKSEYLKTFRHVTGDLEEEQSTNDDEATTLTMPTTTNTMEVPSTPISATTSTADSKLSWEHYINLSPEKQQVSIVDNNVDDDESNHIYDELSTIVKSSDQEKPSKVDVEHLIEENNISSLSIINEQQNCEEISYPATPMISIAALDQLEAVIPLIDNSQSKDHSNNFDTVSAKANFCISQETALNVPDSVDIDQNPTESISTKDNTTIVSIPIPILSNTDKNERTFTKYNTNNKPSRKVTFIENTDNINETLSAQVKFNDTQHVNKNTAKNLSIVNNLSPKLDNQILNDDKIAIEKSSTFNNNEKLPHITSEKSKEMKTNKNNKQRQIIQKKPITNGVKNKQLKSLKKDLTTRNRFNNTSKDVSNKLHFFDIFEEIDLQQKSNLSIPNVKKRQLLATSAPKPTTIATASSDSVSVNVTVGSDEDDDNISLAELKRRNSISLKKKDTPLKHLNNKPNKRGGKSQKNCDISNNLNASSASTKLSSTSTSPGAIVLTLDEVETCDISVVSCEEVVGEGTILLNNTNTSHKSPTTSNNKSETTTTINSTKVNFVNDT